MDDPDQSNKAGSFLTPKGVIETCLYVDDLPGARDFYQTVLGAQSFLEEPGRHVFLKIGHSLVFLFDPRASVVPTPPGEGLPIPTHGSQGTGHVAFSVQDDDIEAWQLKLNQADIPIERVIDWPNGAKSIYFRDPGGNSVELATERLWQDVLNA